MTVSVNYKYQVYLSEGEKIMKTWEDYKNYVKSISKEDRHNIEEIEKATTIISSIIKRRQELGISQRTLAELCNMPHSSIVHIETFKTMPKKNILKKLMKALDLKL